MVPAARVLKKIPRLELRIKDLKDLKALKVLKAIKGKAPVAPEAPNDKKKTLMANS